jgi:putative spermidine/putrescine transport system ATP-binding protein
VFNDGVIQQLAHPTDLYERPENSFVAQFIGENNRLAGVVSSVNGKECLVKVNGQGEVARLPVRTPVRERRPRCRCARSACASIP